MFSVRSSTRLLNMGDKSATITTLCLICGNMSTFLASSFSFAAAKWDIIALAENASSLCVSPSISKKSSTVVFAVDGGPTKTTAGHTLTSSSSKAALQDRQAATAELHSRKFSSTTAFQSIYISYSIPY